MDKTHGFCAALSKKDMTQGKIALVQTISEEGLPLYESLREAFLAHPEYEQVFSGLTHNQRDVLVLDFDETYTELFRDEVFAKCDNLSIPIPSYIEVHENGHWQVGWWLDDYFSQFNMDDTPHIEYNLLVATFAAMFGSDSHFTGGWIKNPFFQGSKVIEYSCNRFSSDIFLKHIADKRRKIHRTTPRGVVNSFMEGKGVGSVSRNCYAFNALRTYIFQYRREHGIFPSKENCYSWIARYEMGTSRGQLYGIENSNKIWSTVHSVLNWCIKTYDESKPRQGINYRLGVIYEKAKKALLYFRYKDLEPGLPGKEAASLLGISPSYLSKIKKENDANMRECLLRFTLVPDNAYKYTDMYREAESRLFV